MNTSATHRRVLVHSPRATGIASPAVSPHLEFEDLLVEIDDAELISPPHRGRGATLERIHNRSSKILHRPARLNVAYEPVTPRADSYDLFFAVLMGPDDVLAVNAIDRWRERCGVAVAWIVEAWEFELDRWKGHWDLLGQFDHLFVPMEPCLPGITARTGVPASYLPTGTDTLLFSPEGEGLFSPEGNGARPIDVLSIGRRSIVTHQHLIDMARAREIFYHYDTIRAPLVKDHVEHRFMYAQLAQRSRFFIANRSKVESDVETGGQHEFGGRFYEAAAAGAISLGAFPTTDRFRENFDWPDANVALEFDADPRAVIEPLLADPDRLEEASRRAVEESLGRHDWLHRWESTIAVAGLGPTPGMERRASQLEARRAVVGV